MTNFKTIKDNNLLLYEYIRGSQCHGLATPTSDIDTGGVFMTPIDNILGIGIKNIEQVADEKNDNVWYSIDKFLRLLLTSNPTMLEALFVPDWCVKYEHPLFSVIKENRNKFITKACFNPFGGYAVSQIKKARGLNKKIVNSIVERKGVLDFCYTFKEQGSTNLENWLNDNGYSQEHCGLVHIPNMHDVYGVYYDEDGTKGYNGICGENSNQVRLSSVSKREKPICYMSYNESGYTKHCIDYKEFKDWEKNRNPIRYESNLDKNYDAKNMCECFRLIRMCTEIATTGKLLCDRSNIDREFLLSIKQHKFEYDELIGILEEEKLKMDDAISKSTIPDKIEESFVQELAINIKKKFYNI